VDSDVAAGSVDPSRGGGTSGAAAPASPSTDPTG